MTVEADANTDALSLADIAQQVRELIDTYGPDALCEGARPWKEDLDQWRESRSGWAEDREQWFKTKVLPYKKYKDDAPQPSDEHVLANAILTVEGEARRIRGWIPRSLNEEPALARVLPPQRARQHSITEKFVALIALYNFCVRSEASDSDTVQRYGKAELQPLEPWGNESEDQEAFLAGLILHSQVDGHADWGQEIMRAVSEFVGDVEHWLKVEGHAIKSGGSALRGVSEPPKDKPTWNRHDRTIRFRGVTVKKFAKNATSQFDVLDAFQADGWPDSIDDPLPYKEEGARERANETARSLNDRAQGIRFSVSDGGNRFLWRISPETG